MVSEIHDDARMGWFDKAVHRLESVMLILLILVAGLVAFSFFPIKGEQRLFVVQSGSMEPALPVGSLIFVHSYDSYGVGDIVTRRTDQPKVTITHRVIGTEMRNGATVYRTKGDANRDEDGEPVMQRSVVGKVVFHVPYAGYIISFAKTPWGFTFLVVIPALLIIVDEFNNIRKELGRREEARRYRETVADMRIDV